MEIDKPGGSIYYIFVTAMVPAAGVIPQVNGEAGVGGKTRKHCQQHLVAVSDASCHCPFRGIFRRTAAGSFDACYEGL